MVISFFSVLAGVVYFLVGYAFAFGEGNGFIEHSYFARSELMKTLYTKWLFLFFSVCMSSLLPIGYAIAFGEGNGFIGHSNFAHSEL